MSEVEVTESAAVLPPVIRSRLFKPVLVASLIVYFIFLLFSKIPASVAAWGVHKALPNVWLMSVQGTLWEGIARGSQVDIGNQTLPLGQVRWTLNPWTLLILKPCLAFDTNVSGQLISGHVCQSPFGSTEVKDVNIEVPISIANELLPMETAGQLSLQVIEASLSGEKVDSIDGRFSWQNARVHNGETWLSLGSFAGQATANGEGGVQAKLFDISGPFGLDMSASWTPGAENWTANGTVTPKTGAPKQVIQALQVVGEETDAGAYTLSWP